MTNTIHLTARTEMPGRYIDGGQRIGVCRTGSPGSIHATRLEYVTCGACADAIRAGWYQWVSRPEMWDAFVWTTCEQADLLDDLAYARSIPESQDRDRAIEAVYLTAELRRLRSSSVRQPPAQRYVDLVDRYRPNRHTLIAVRGHRIRITREEQP